MENHQRINQDSGETDYYTPSAIVEAARRVMGGIDLDPASSAIANFSVKAREYYTAPAYHDIILPGYDLPVRHFQGDGGLYKVWLGRILLNHPFSPGELACRPGCQKKVCQKRGWHTANSTPGNAEWIKYLNYNYLLNHTTAACCITYASISEKWFAPLLAYPIAFISPRVDYLLPDGTVKKGVTKGSCVTYLGGDVAAFAHEFNGRIGDSKYIGRVFVPLA